MSIPVHSGNQEVNADHLRFGFRIELSSSFPARPKRLKRTTGKIDRKKLTAPNRIIGLCVSARLKGRAA